MSGLSLLFLILLSSCSKSPSYTQREFMNAIERADPSAEQVPIPNTEPHRRVICENYGNGCVDGSGRRVRIRKVELIAIMFETEELARKEAERLDQYYVRNWLLDNTRNEPVLIDFVTNELGASPGRATPE